MEKQLSLELKILSSGKQPNSSPTKHLSRKIVQKPKQKNQERQFVKELLPKKEKESKLKALSLEGVETEESTLKETPPAVHSSKKKLLIDNLITIEELAVIFRLAPQTIRNWIALGKIPYVRIGRKSFFQQRSLQKWLNRKEKPLWQ